MAISPVDTVWRAFNVLTTKFQKLRFDRRETKAVGNNPAAKPLDKGSGKFGKLNVTFFRPRALYHGCLVFTGSFKMASSSLVFELLAVVGLVALE